MTFRSLLEDILRALAWAFLPFVLLAIGIGLGVLGDRFGMDFLIWVGMAIAVISLIWIALRWLFDGSWGGD